MNSNNVSISAMEKANMNQPFRRTPSELMFSNGDLLLTDLEKQVTSTVFIDSLRPGRIDAVLGEAKQKDMATWVIDSLDLAIQFAENNEIFGEDKELTDIFPRCSRANTINEIRACIIGSGPTTEAELPFATVNQPVLEIPANIGATNSMLEIADRIDTVKPFL